MITRSGLTILMRTVELLFLGRRYDPFANLVHFCSWRQGGVHEDPPRPLVLRLRVEAEMAQIHDVDKPCNVELRPESIPSRAFDPLPDALPGALGSLPVADFRPEFSQMNDDLFSVAFQGVRLKDPYLFLTYDQGHYDPQWHHDAELF
jgi:hypothetical protein